MTLPAGTRIGAYETIALLGAGGMGEVYRARDTTLNREVAVKVLPAGLALDADAMRRFEQEAFAASSLNHPNILTIFAAGEAHGHRFIASELVEGESLRARLNRNGRIALPDALDIAVQVAAALGAAHAAGIVHRDIKPDNVMLRPDGYVKVLDFGIAKLLPQHASSDEAKTVTQQGTRTGVLVGTLPYMSPEQARGTSVDARTDVWSFGCLLYEMLTGRRPFTGETTTDVLVAIVDKDPLPVSQIAQVPDKCDWIVAKMLRKNPAERYHAAGELLGDLRQLQQDVAAASRSTAPVQAARIADARPKSHWRTVAAAIVALAMIGSAAWYMRPVTAEAKSLAVLPLKSLTAGEDYLGLGIADAVIRKTSQAGGLIVRPTSAVKRYASGDTDALTAAHELHTDVVLEGNVQRDGTQLRVSVNLLRASDGSSIWADSFDLPAANIFTIQDTVAQQVASHLRLKLDPAQKARLARHGTTSPAAYDLYSKGLQVFDQRLSMTDMQRADMIDLFTKATELDPRYAQAHALLGYTYAISAVFRHSADDQADYRMAKAAIARAQAIDPDLPEVAAARYQLLASRFEGFQLTTAVHVIQAAQQLDPASGQEELGYLYMHMGLEDEAEQQLLNGLELDPTSAFKKQLLLDVNDWGSARYAHWQELHDRYKPSATVTPWLYLDAGRLDDAQRVLEAAMPFEKGDYSNSEAQAVLSAMRGDRRAADKAIQAFLERHPVKDPFYHHDVAAIAAIYAIEGKSADAVRWLREAEATGYYPYPMYQNGHIWDRIRTAPEFVQFMSELKAKVDGHRRDFAH